jgi:hypothetical protein
MLDLVDKMPIYERDYPIINSLLENLESSLFVKILEEVLEENIFFSDFERIFPDESYAETLKENLEKQEELRNEITRLVYFRKEILGENFDQRLRTGIPLPDETSPYLDFYNDISSEERDIIIRSLFEYNENDSDLVRGAKIELRNKILIQDSGFSKDDLLLFAESFILPLDFRHQVLNRNDRNFMLENNLSDDEMKKIKTLSLFLKRQNEVIE